MQLGLNMYPVVQPAAQLLKVLRPACITCYGLLLRNTSVGKTVLNRGQVLSYFSQAVATPGISPVEYPRPD